MSVTNEMARQVHHTKPDEFEPGKDVGMAVLDTDTLYVLVIPTMNSVAIRYDRGWDEYVVACGKGATQGELLRALDGEEIEGVTRRSNVLCTDLGQICFGEKAKPYTMPVVTIMDEHGNVVAEF